MKRLSLLIPAALVLPLALAGCTAQAAPGMPKDCTPAGDASKSVQVEGDFGKTLKLTSKTPLKAKELERSVLIEGKGDTTAKDGGVSAAVTLFNGRTGKVVQAIPETPLMNDAQQLPNWAYQAVRCSVKGQRVAMAMPATDLANGQPASSLGIPDLKDGDSIVAVIDVTKQQPGTLSEGKLLKKAEGTAKKAPEGFPTVKLAENGEPTITIPKGVKAPTTLKTATLIEGKGETVKPGDRVYVNYRGVIWSTGKEFDSSWSRGKPTDFLTTGVIGGFQKALEGQKVGSQIISVVPAATDQGGYGPEKLQQMGHKADDVMVFVLDILGTVHEG